MLKAIVILVMLCFGVSSFANTEDDFEIGLALTQAGYDFLLPQFNKGLQ